MKEKKEEPTKQKNERELITNQKKRKTTMNDREREPLAIKCSYLTRRTIHSLVHKNRFCFTLAIIIVD